jgi:hypothetical protein
MRQKRTILKRIEGEWQEAGVLEGEATPDTLGWKFGGPGDYLVIDDEHPHGAFQVFVRERALPVPLAHANEATFTSVYYDDLGPARPER